MDGVPELAHLRSTTLPALVMLWLWPVFMLTPARYARAFFCLCGPLLVAVVGGPLLAVALLIAIFVGYYAAEFVARAKSNRRALLRALLLVLHVGYWGCFLVEPPAAFSSIPLNGAPTVFVLFSGVGLTFFRLVSYTCDRYAGKLGPTPLADYLAYMLFFPQLRHGPIERCDDLAVRVEAARRRWRLRDGAAGVLRLLWVMAAFQILIGVGTFARGRVGGGSLTDTIETFLDHPERLPVVTFLLVLHAPMLMLYFAESLFTHVVLGVARIFGVAGRENYRYPFWATSPQGVWRRWNITLSNWLRDYCFRPLGSRCRPLIALAVTFMYCGLLHGLQLRFVVWGVWMAATVTLAIAIERRIRKRTRGVDLHPIVRVAGATAGRLATWHWAAWSVVILLDYEHCGWRVARRFVLLFAGQ